MDGCHKNNKKQKRYTINPISQKVYLKNGQHIPKSLTYPNIIFLLPFNHVWKVDCLWISETFSLFLKPLLNLDGHSWSTYQLFAGISQSHQNLVTLKYADTWEFWVEIIGRLLQHFAYSENLKSCYPTRWHYKKMLFNRQLMNLQLANPALASKKLVEDE